MRSRYLLLYIFLNSSATLLAQDFSQPARDALMITRMAANFHVHPRPLDDTFSVDVFNQLISILDENKIYFTQSDLKNLEKYKTQLDDEIKLSKTDFLKIATNIFTKRLRESDSMISIIARKAFDFSMNEKVTRQEINSFPTDAKSTYTKLYKMMKTSALYRLLDDERLIALDAGKRKKYVDSIEPGIRQKVRARLQNAIQIILQNPGGPFQYVSDSYCKSIAVCYDPHTEYFPVREKENFESELGQRKMVFGFQLERKDDGTIQIENVVPGSPAYKSGQINKGDKILSIQWDNGAPINVGEADGQFLNQVLSLSNRGKATLQIKKLDGTIKSVTLWKEQANDDEEENKVRSFILKGNKSIGFISLPAFYQDWDNKTNGTNGCANDIGREILKLKKENIQGLILDLRYNGGGSVREAVELAGIFIDAGPVGQVKERDTKTFTLMDVNRGTMYDGPLVLLVNGYSASASELLAGTLQDYHRALIVGSPTYGKATAQVILPLDTAAIENVNMDNLPGRSFIKMTISQLFRVNGTTAQFTGVLPDILVPDLSELSTNREKDQSFAIKPSTVAPVRFRALAEINSSYLNSLAKLQMDSSVYFIQLKKYIDLMKSDNTPNEISLRLTDAIADKQEPEQEIQTSGSEDSTKANFIIANNAFENQQILANERLKEMNNQWIKFLSNDAQLRVAFNIISSLIK